MSFSEMPGTPCMMCNDKNRNYPYDVLRKISNIVSDLPDDEENTIFYWDIHSRCRFGMHCPSLQNNDIRARDLAEQIEKKMIYAAKNDTDRYFRVMRLLQGEFPRVYKLLERIHYSKKRKREGKEGEDE